MVAKSKPGPQRHPLTSMPGPSDLRRRDGQPEALAAEEIARLHAEIDDLRQRLVEAHAQAEAAERAKSVFLAHMSHELRTPLNAVIGFAELIQSQIHGRGPMEKYKEYAADIAVSGRHLLFLIDSLLDVSRSQSAPARRDGSATVGVASLLAAGVQALRESGAARHVEIDLLPVDPTLALAVDAGQVRQALGNLLANAAKYTPAGGRIVVGVERAEDGGCALAVEDSGIGIPPAELARLVTAFGASEGWRRRANEGSGFGLTLARAFAEANGARLEIASEPGRGTRACLRFAADRVAAAPRS